MFPYALACRNLRKAFGQKSAVLDVSLQVAPGDCLGLLGPNGAGKTTTLSMITGLLPPDGGSVEIGAEGGAPTDPQVRRRLGVAPQSLALYDALTAQENLEFFGRIYGLAGAALSSRTAWALQFAGLTDRRTDRVEGFSGGMKRRLNLAVALMHEPEILLLDEPTVGVDPQSRNAILESLETLRAAGMTIIYTTHYMEEATRLCNRIAIVDHGRVLAEGSLVDLLSQHGGASTLRGVWRGERGLAPADIVSALQPDGAFAVRLPQPAQAIASWTESQRASMVALEIVAPSLEDVFLHLTGRKLRDA